MNSLVLVQLHLLAITIHLDCSYFRKINPKLCSQEAEMCKNTIYGCQYRTHHPPITINILSQVWKHDHRGP